MHTVSIAEVRKEIAEIANRTAYGKERVLVKRRNKELFALVPIEDLRQLEILDEMAKLREMDISLAEAEEKGTIPWSVVRDKLLKDIKDSQSDTPK